MDPSGSNVRPVFTRKRKFYRDSPTWSPDGKQIAYTHLNWNGVRFHIHIATLGEQKEARVVEGRYPTWSPDGTKIAYVSYIADTCRIALIDLHTRRQKHLPTEDGNGLGNINRFGRRRGVNWLSLGIRTRSLAFCRGTVFHPYGWIKKPSTL